MSIEQLAAATKIPRRSLEMLEEDRYDALPGPVFVKGFIRCVARSLGVEVQAVMDLLYERERAAIASKRTGRPVPAPTPMPAAEAGAGRAAPRRAKVAAATPSWADAVRGRLPSPAVFLWVVVAAFVAAVVLAAFNLVGGGPAGAS